MLFLGSSHILFVMQDCTDYKHLQNEEKKMLKLHFIFNF